MWEKIRFHTINGVINAWKAFPASYLCRGIHSTYLNYSLSSPEKLSRLPLPPPHLSPWPSGPGNACPILTSFVLPTGLWFSTRPGKSNYTGVREVDFPIIDSMLRMRADDNTHITPLLPPLFLLPYLFCLHFTVSLPLFLPLFLSNSSFPRRPSFFPLSLFFRISPSFIVHYSNFSEQRNEARAPSSFQFQNAGSVGLLHTHIGHFVTFNISVLPQRQERYITSLCPSREFLIPSHFFYVLYL